jgi:hypothetical protein
MLSRRRRCLPRRTFDAVLEGICVERQAVRDFTAKVERSGWSKRRQIEEVSAGWGV